MSGNITQKMLGGARRKNGHKTSCNCHICENMRSKAKRGGYQDDYEKIVTGGSKKKNGHKANCKCPICKNMNKKMRKGGTEPDYKAEDMKKKDITYDETKYTTKIPKLENSENMKPSEEFVETELVDSDLEDDLEQNAGSRRRRKSHRRKSRKNRRIRKGGNGEPDIENQMGDLEEGGIRSTMDQPVVIEEDVVVTEGDNYDKNELERAELGESGVNKVGGSRRRRRSHRRKTRRNKKHSRRHRK